MNTSIEAILANAISEAIDKAGVTELAIAADFAEQHAIIREKNQPTEEQEWSR